MQKTTIAVIGLATSLALAPGPARAADSMGLAGEKEFTAKVRVVDVACEVTKDCPFQCGAGKRLLGLKSSDGKLLLAAKDTGPFTGAVRDLMPFCGKEIFVDGITVTNYGSTLFMLQRYRGDEKKPWIEANQTVIDWAKTHKVKLDGPEAAEWFRNDAMIKAAVAKKGKLGVPE
ncbi:MAG: hypothetical protein HYR63_29440 [Proteobacteria bacterium]|nr:hypothetical protein [Pseudomonadota bacterium]